MYKSPSIEIFENVQRSIAVPTAGTGFATVGFSTNGPINKLMQFNNLADFEKYMGRPVANYEFTHNMINRAMNTGFGGSLYFMRVGKFTEEEDGKASVAVSNYTGGTSYDFFFSSEIQENRLLKPWFVAQIDDLFEDAPATAVYTLSFDLNTDIPISKSFTLTKLVDQVGLYDTQPSAIDVYAISIDKIVRGLNNDRDFSSLATAYSISEEGEYGLRIVGKGIGSSFSISGFSFAYETTGDTVLDDKFITTYEVEIEGSPSAEYTNEGNQLIGEDAVLDTITAFSIISKNPGSSMNGAMVRKVSTVNPFSGEESFTLSVYANSNTSSLLETFEELTLENFASKINDASYGSDFITIDGYVYEEGVSEFKDGSYVLGEGEVLPDGSKFVATGDYEPIVGTDGVPMDGASSGIAEEEVVQLFVDALRDYSFRNMDNVDFSIIATPDSQEPEVQDAAVELARNRGDCIYLVDVPLDYMGSKSKVEQAIAWHNGSEGRATAIDSSYAAIYYGWLTQKDAYGSNNLILPPSVFVLPKMLQIDYTQGPSFAPAGSNRGRIVASDYMYSPDLEDREKMCGDYNCINPIIFSNTKGLMIFAQKTADRSTSPLNRINIRRMLNDIKRKMYVSLDAVRFELNNPTTQERARKIVSDILYVYRNIEALQSYSVNVSSPGGAEADVLNIVIDMVPYGLVERIRIYLNVSEAGAVVSEA
jgi:hypothetical protein